MQNKTKTRPEVRIENRKAKFDYEFIDKYVAGIVLKGSEVKSIREGRVSLVDTFCSFVQYELWVYGMTITPIRDGMHEGNTPRKLLLKKAELNRLNKDLREGMTIVITRMFTVNGRIKAEVALARGKKLYDKRETIKARDIDRDTKREL